MNSLPQAWYSTHWFSPAAFSSYTWVYPIFIDLLPVVPLLFVARWLARRFYARPLAVAVARGKLPASPLALLRWLPDIVLALALALILVALARPQRTDEKVEQWAEGIDIMLAIDLSQSMQIEDFTPNRLEAAKKVAREFIDGRLQDRIGIVVFSGEAFSLAPLTIDYDLLRTHLADIDFDMIESRGTAIGSALAVATNRMAESEARSKVCILLSDGDNTAGNIDPITAAQLAAAYGIKIYTILVGKEGLVPFGKDYFGRPQMVENTVDGAAMRKIAEIGSGEFFRATNNEALRSVFFKIDQYEKAKIKENRFKNVMDFYFIYLRWAILFFLLWLTLKSTFINNALQD